MDALCHAMRIGLEVKNKLFKLCELVSGDLGKSGIGSDKRVEHGLLVGDGHGHVVEMAL